MIAARVETALSDDESDVVQLFVRSVATHFIDHCGNHVARRKVSMELKTVQQALLTELLAVRTARLSDTVCIKSQSVSCEETRFAN